MSFAIAEISALLDVRAETRVFGKETPLRTNDKSVSKCSAVLALPPFPMIQIEFWLVMQLKILVAAEFKSSFGIDINPFMYSK